MRVFKGFDALPKFRNPAASIGSYDGVHLGHKAMITKLVEQAALQNGESIVLTFDPHPRVTLGSGKGLQILTSLSQKLELLQQLGVDNVIVIPFDKAFSALSGAEFIERYIIGQLGIQSLVVGFNHRFGHDRVEATQFEYSHSLTIIRVDECIAQGSHVSSTAIRQLLDQGDRVEAERLLGHKIE